MFDKLTLPERQSKPRSTGRTCIIDNGYGTAHFIDTIESHHPLVDAVKFGWGTSMVTKDLERKIAILREHQIDYLFGGTLLEVACLQNQIDAFSRFVERHQCPIVEVSDGTIPMSPDEKCDLIQRFSKDHIVWSEVGYKDQQRSLDLPPSKWIEFMKASLECGADMVLTEARESGTSGICRSDGEVRFGLIEDILASGIKLEEVMFESPNKSLQTYFVKRVGSNANLANVAFADIVGLETLRLGLRSDSIEL
ncbi:MAG: phosphosulfolactate synthase [Verrucomicrobiales bacterium]